MNENKQGSAAMKVAGFKMTDPWASRVLRSKGVETERVASAPVETVVLMERVSFEHHGSDKNYRPLLHLTGELRSILPDEALPYGVEEVTFRSGLGPTVDAFYEFDDAQLTELVSKGYFTEGFEPPSTMAGIPWELPTTIDALILAPEHNGDAPVVFVTIHGQTELALDAENSGYDLAEYFENKLTPEAQQEQALLSTQRGVPTRSGEINDLFAAEQFTTPDAAQRFEALTRQSSGEFPVVRASIFEDLMADFRQKRTAEAAELAAQPVEYDPDTVEGVYHQRIVPGVAKALTLPSEDTVTPDVAEPEETSTDAPDDGTSAGDGAQAPEKEQGLLDLYEEGEEDKELDVVPVATTPAVEKVWEPESETTVAGVQEDAVQDDTKAEQRNRRVHRTLEHEKALERDSDKAGTGPELG
ncbi:UNVERIFIED_ORG: hypothetical protein ABIB52_000688 [Arthrobacter sp. UYCu721]